MQDNFKLDWKCNTYTVRMKHMNNYDHFIQVNKKNTVPTRRKNACTHPPHLRLSATSADFNRSRPSDANSCRNLLNKSDQIATKQGHCNPVNHIHKSSFHTSFCSLKCANNQQWYGQSPTTVNRNPLAAVWPFPVVKQFSNKLSG